MILAIDLGGTYCRLAVFNNGNIVKQKKNREPKLTAGAGRISNKLCQRKLSNKPDRCRRTWILGQ